MKVVKRLLYLFGDVEVFPKQNTDLGSATRPKVLTFFDDPEKRGCLGIEIAATVNTGMPFVKATYTLEGDGPLVLECCQIIATLPAAVRVAHYLNVQAVSRRLYQGNSQVQQQWMAYTLQCMKPGIDYYNHHLSECLQSLSGCFQGC